jgi:hypothetical protein
VNRWVLGRSRDFGPGSVVMMPANWAHVSAVTPAGK